MIQTSNAHSDTDPAERAKTQPPPGSTGRLIRQVELLLDRYESGKQANALLQLRVQSLTRERDLLKARNEAADQRLSALLIRLHANDETD